MGRRNALIRIILITTILFISALGISYASWNDNISIVSSFQMGKTEISVYDYKIEPDPAGQASVTFDNDTSLFHIEAVLDGDNDSTLTLFLKNTGSLPVYIDNKRIKPNESDTVQIDIDENFAEYQIKYSLFETNDRWAKFLTIAGNFTIAEETSIYENLQPENIVQENKSKIESIVDQADNALNGSENEKNENDNTFVETEIKENSNGQNGIDTDKGEEPIVEDKNSLDTEAEEYENLDDTNK